MRSRSESVRLVRIVTAMSSGGRTTPSIDSRAARSIASPPLACTLSIHTPRRAAARQAPATVFGMSWNFKSRKTSKPRSWRRAMTAGPSATKSSLPTLTRQSLGSRRAANASAGSAAPKSSGTMMRLLSNLHPREMASRVLELRVDEAVEAHERRIAAHLVAHQPPRRLVALVLRGRLVDHAQQVEPRIAMLQSAQQRQTLVGAAERLVAFDHPVGGKSKVGGVLRFDRLPRLDRRLVTPGAREPLAAQKVGAHAFAVGLEPAREVRLRLRGSPMLVRSY